MDVETQCFKVDAPLIAEQLHLPRYVVFSVGLCGRRFGLRGLRDKEFMRPFYS